MSGERYYFAYGSNLHRAQMMARCRTAVPHRALALLNWRLVFRVVADVTPAAGAQVQGALWQVRPLDEIVLDRYEGIAAGLYRKQELKFAGGLRAFMYVMCEREFALPPTAYYDTIAEGYRDWGLPLHSLAEALEHTAAAALQPVANFDLAGNIA